MAAGDHRTDAAVAAAPQQVAYHPKSCGTSLGTLVPANMQAGTTQALLRLEREVGSLDAYVTERLAYSSPQELHRYFSAEQVDAIALSIANLEKGSGFILGDQTGIGKGRVVAAMIRYACISDRTPIFVTKDPPLYADMVRDLRDIGMAGFRPLVTNPDLQHLPLPDGRTLHSAPKRHNALLKTIQQAGHLQEYDAIFTTYTQMQTVKGKEPERRDFLRAFAPNSILILDESHEAGGSIGGGAERGLGNRADFVRELAQTAQGVVYSSATYAKDPAVMDLYARTDMRKALSNMETLTELVATGGVPLQQTLAAMLTEAGQYVRRERSFAGVSFEPATVAVNHDTAEKVSRIMADIMEFDRLKQQAVKGIDKLLKAEAKEVHGDNATGGAGASSTNFTSIMHNVIDQMLFALKAEETVQRCLHLLEQEHPEKPVLALSNTMGSLIASQAELQGLAPGDPLEVDFGVLLQRYLERSRDIIVGNPWGEKSRQRLSEAELGEVAAAQYQAIAERIADTDFAGLPISPIDYITHRLHQAGHRVGEVTGREHIAVYKDDGSTRYQRRSHRERTKEAAVRTVKAFNDGDLDVIILNRSGSTGISLHASERFADRRQRHMLVVQPEADINQFMQMLGRVHRTGQVVPPNFTLLMADLPAEKRPGAVLARKMASLNANTTAARASGFGLGDIPDFMNEYGDRMVADLMKADPALHAALDYPLDSREGIITDGAIRRVTGRIPLLPIQEQEEVYNRIEQQYRAYVASQEALGESVLEASTLNLDAVTVARMEIVPADFDSQSPFTAAVYAEICDTRAPRKPYTSQQVAEKLCKVLSLPVPADCSPEVVERIQDAGREQASATQEALEEAARRYKLQVPMERAAAIDNGMAHIGGILAHFPVGQTICLHSDKEQEFYGVVGSVERTGLSSNPAAASSWEMRLLLADALRELRLPLSQVNTGRDNAVRLEMAETSPQGVSVYQMFDDCQQRTRETRQILTGNLLRAWEKFPGQIVNFTDAHGSIRQGLLTRRGFDVEQALEHLGVSMPTPQDAKTFLQTCHGQLQTSDQRLTITAGEPGTVVLQTPKAKDAGGCYYLDEALLAAAEAEFFSVGDRMECTAPNENLEAVLQVLMVERGYTLAAYNQQQQAREMLGMALPQFVPVEQSPPPPTPAPLEPQERPWEEMRPDRADIPVGEEGQGQAAVMSAFEQEGDVPAVTTDKEEDSSTAETGISPSPNLPPAIAPRQAQAGMAAQNIAKLLEQGGLLEAVMTGDDFHVKTENAPYIPLVIERHGDQLTLTHYLSQNGDSYIDSEMVFAIAADGRLSLTETAVAALGGELRYCDQQFAALFSENLLQQGFGEAIARSHSQDEATATIPEEIQEEERKDAMPDPLPSAAILDERRHPPAPRSPPSPLPAPYPTALEVSLWAMAARDLGLPEPARRSVQILYDKVRDGEQPAMPPKVWKTMARDVEQYQPYRERGQQLLGAAQWILAQAGTENARQERVFKGNTYEITATNKMLTVTRCTEGKTDVILQAHDNRIVRTTVTPDDVAMFAAFVQCLQGERNER